MAKRTSAPPPVNEKMAPDQIRSVIVRFERRVEELKQLDITTITSGDDPILTKLSSSIENTIAAFYRPGSHEYNRLLPATKLDLTSYTMSIEPLWAGSGRRGIQVADIQNGINKGVNRAVALLQGKVDSLNEELEAFGEAGASSDPKVKSPAPLPLEVFVVHGHDDAAREEAARFLAKAGLNPVILHEKASGGMTVIEKLERYSEVGFAVVLLTPDDVGGPQGANPASLQARARQNVIAELFYFLGKLGRKHVCALKKGEIEIPSDIGGIVYINMNDGGWKQELLRELEDVGFAIDWAKALR